MERRGLSAFKLYWIHFAGVWEGSFVNKKAFWHRIILVALVLGLMGFVSLAQSKFSLEPQAKTDRHAFFRPELARLATFGFHALVADYYWIQSVQLVGETMTPEIYSEEIGQYIDLVTTIDPWVTHPYDAAAIWLVNSKAQVLEANRLLKRGIEYHPDRWRTYYHLAFNLFFYLEEIDEAADVLTQAMDLPGAPIYLRRMVAKLRAGGEDLEVAASFLRQFVESVEDETARELYLKGLNEIDTERVARLLDVAHEEYKKRNGKDIEEVEDLLRGESPVLHALPPHPGGEGSWVISNRGDGRIVSSIYLVRYELHGREHARLQRAGWPDADVEYGEPDGDLDGEKEK